VAEVRSGLFDILDVLRHDRPGRPLKVESTLRKKVRPRFPNVSFKKVTGRKSYFRNFWKFAKNMHHAHFIFTVIILQYIRSD
jgi:hypothetical protein